MNIFKFKKEIELFKDINDIFHTYIKDMDEFFSLEINVLNNKESYDKYNQLKEDLEFTLGEK